jgi:hypothetical protein
MNLPSRHRARTLGLLENVDEAAEREGWVPTCAFFRRTHRWRMT